MTIKPKGGGLKALVIGPLVEGFFLRLTLLSLRIDNHFNNLFGAIIILQ